MVASPLANFVHPIWVNRRDKICKKTCNYEILATLLQKMTFRTLEMD